MWLIVAEMTPLPVPNNMLLLPSYHVRGRRRVPCSHRAGPPCLVRMAPMGTGGHAIWLVMSLFATPGSWSLPCQAPREPGKNTLRHCGAEGEEVDAGSHGNSI